MADYESLTLPHNARQALVQALGEGTLTIFLGAGVSLGSGLPDWPELIKRMGRRAGLDFRGISASSTASDLQNATEEVRQKLRDDREYLRVVKEALYEGVELSDTQLQDRLLIALGALMMGSRRGSVNRVVTFNFDSVLEWYIALCGFIPRVVVDPTHLEGAEDVRIYHPHGFFAHPSVDRPDGDFVILGQESINRRLGTPGDPWFELLRHLFSTSYCLFVGMSYRSFEDPALAPLLTTVGDRVGARRPLGFWLLPEGDPSTFSSEDRRMLGRNVVPVRVQEKSDVARFLLAVCQEAAHGSVP